MPRRSLWCAALIAAVLLPLPVRAYELPAAAAIPGIIGHPQSLSLDCESRSAADWAAYWGVFVDEITFFTQLPKTDNPETGFVGSVYDNPGNLPPRGYGVYAGPVATLLKEAYGLPAAARRDLTEFELKAEIASGRPVIVWYIYGFRVTAAYDLTSSSGSTYRAANFEHTGIVTGYDSATYTVVDAYTGWAQRVDRGQFLNSWAVLGNIAITGSGIDLDPLVLSSSASASSAAPVYYTVQPGDTVGKIAGRLGVPWSELAAANNLYPPYTIYPGQQLLIPGSGSPAPAQPVAEPAADTSSLVPSAYTVQHGDTLAGIARAYGLSWPDIASANGISWPYTIYPGQVLVLPER
jgi:LysM repeat protein